MSSTTNTTRQMYTRHWGMIAITVITTAITALGIVGNNIPSFATYAETTAIPDIITIADFIAARLKDSKGLSGISLSDVISLIGTLKDLVDKVPTVIKPTTVVTASATQVKSG